MDRSGMAQAVAAAVTASGRAAKVWERGDHVRVYVSRDLSRGAQDMGYIAIDGDGSRNYGGLVRNRAGVRDGVEAVLATAVAS